jgi:dipeptidyl aminopeptidase/acylaminoacyl peptidase
MDHRTTAYALAATVLAAALSVATQPARAADRRAFTIADFYRIKEVEAPRVSPDGRTIAYVVRTRDLAKATRTARIWLVDADGTNRRPLTAGEKQDTDPCWSPDGRTIAFVSTRSGSPQLWLIPRDGGEAAPLTDVSTGVSEPQWSPAGGLIAFTSDVYPECGATDSCSKALAERRDKGSLKAHLADHLLYRHWTEWKDGKRTHILVADVATKAVRDLTPGDFDAPVFQAGGPGDFAFSPDGRELCYASNHDADPARSTNSDLWTVLLAGGEARNLTAANHAFDGTPRYSPDGRWIAYRTQSQPRYESDRIRLALYDRATGAVRPLADAFDYWVDDFQWTSDSKRIVFTADWKGRVPLFAVDLQGRVSEKPLADLGTVDAFDLAPGADWAALVRRGIGSPWELFRARLGGEAKRLSFENEAVEKEVDIRPAESIEVAGADGHPVQVYIVKPHDFDPQRKYPLILNVHGGPQSQWSDAFRGDWQVYPGAGYVVAFPNPHGSTGFGQDYTAAISRDYGGKVMQDLDAVAAALAQLPYVDADRMGAMGWSWGGYAMMWLEGHNTRFRCLASMMGLYDLGAFYGATEELWYPAWDLGGAPWDSPLYRRDSPSEYVKDFKTPCLVITGERDFRIPYTQSLEFFTALQNMNVPSRLIVFEKAGHWPAWYEMALYYNAHLEWFHTYLGGGPAPWSSEEMVRNGPPFEVGK